MSEGKINQLVEELSKLSVLDMSKLKTALEDAWGVKAAAAAAPMMMAAAPAAAAAVEESTDFQVVLEEAPADKKIGIIKVVREITGLGLKEAKDLVEAAPKPVKDSAPKAQAAEMKKKLEEAGAKVSLKGL
ncbi:MAG: 50S ribosomal protein L7/L12 [Simkaniaceae bacterium]|nr:50S ribosomal protein L7/L12 [Simkaniaceae bacterium]